MRFGAVRLISAITQRGPTMPDLGMGAANLMHLASSLCNRILELIFSWVIAAQNVMLFADLVHFKGAPLARVAGGLLRQDDVLAVAPADFQAERTFQHCLVAPGLEARRTGCFAVRAESIRHPPAPDRESGRGFGSGRHAAVVRDHVAAAHRRPDRHLSSLTRAVDESAFEVGHLNLRVADSVDRDLEQVAIQNDDLRRLADFDRTGVLL